MSKDALPATWQLGVALGAFFALFNQVLFLALAFLAASDDADSARDPAPYLLASLIIGAAVSAFCLALCSVARPLSERDLLAIALAAVAGVGGVLFLGIESRLGVASAVSIFNLLLSIWLTRGLWRRRV